MGKGSYKSAAIAPLAAATLYITAAGAAWAETASATESAAVPVRAPANGGFSLTYDVYQTGFRVLSLQFDLALKGETYRTDARLESAGIVGWLFEWRLDAISSGRWQDSSIEPRRHRFANHWRGSVRSVEIGYRDGVPADVRAKPPYGNDAERAVSPDMLPGSVDPMSAVTAIVLANTSGELCRPRTAVYDGRRRYDAQLTPLGKRTFKTSNQAVFAGRAEGCKLNFERIAGFKPGDERMKKMSVDIWLADIGTGSGPTSGKVPVRLELHTPWGTGFAHLSRARRADGTLVLGDAEE